MRNVFKKKLRAFIATFCLSVLLFHSVHIPTAEARLYDPFNTVQTGLEAVYGGITAFKTSSLEIKEYVLDQIAHLMKTEALQGILGSMTQFINTGFEGNPAFVQNLYQHTLSEMDGASNLFLETQTFASMPPHIQEEVRRAIAQEYEEFRNPKKRLDHSINEDISGLLAGNEFSWTSFYDVGVQLGNSTIGATMIGKEELDRRLDETEVILREELKWGEGVLSEKNCEQETGSTPVSAQGGSARDPLACSIVTPAKFITEQYIDNVDSGREALIKADELNEIIEAIFSNFGLNAITGIDGLIGIANSNILGQLVSGSEFTDVFESLGGLLESDSSSNSGVAVAAQTPAGLTPPPTVTEPETLRETIVFEQEFAQTFSRIINDIDAAGESVAEQCGLEDPLLTGDLGALREEHARNFADTVGLITQLQFIEDSIERATTDQERTRALVEFTTLRTTQNSLHTLDQQIKLKEEVTTIIQPEIERYTTLIAERGCPLI